MIDLFKVQSVKCGNLRYSADILLDNMDYVIYLRKCFGVDKQYYDDFEQLAYFALLETIRVYNFEYKNTFKSLWRRYVLKQYLDFRLEQVFAIKVSRGTYTQIKKTIGIENSKLIACHPDTPVEFGAGLHFDVDYIVSKKLLWDEVSQNLSRDDFFIVYNFYKNELSLFEISKYLHLSVNTVKQRKYKALKRLRHNVYLQMLGCDYFGLTID